MTHKGRSHLCHAFPMAVDKVFTVWLQQIAHLHPYIVNLYVPLSLCISLIPFALTCCSSPANRSMRLLTLN